ncbi:MAG: hypothetical protein II468_03180 [Lachnospiraceae bacterium]|nr:hypothetical protein [Lachnospiraceae bacterium]
MKKLNVLALTGAMVAAMSVSAFAGTVNYNGFSDSDSYGEFINPGKYVDDMTKVATVEMTFDSIPELNGCYEVSANSDSWGWDAVNLDTKGVVSGATIIAPCTFDAGDAGDDGKGFAKVQAQYWADGTITLQQLVMKDASGAVLYDSAAGSGEVTPEPTGDVSPVVYLAAIVAIAGIAMVASKKRA